ncbi:hypothetical protein NQZ68_034172 [Dissostichus eleginoides]|nr:hypothetical protein NQZ68_034172 [Dissostichus eleginoides]
MSLQGNGQDTPVMMLCKYKCFLSVVTRISFDFLSSLQSHSSPEAEQDSAQSLRAMDGPAVHWSSWRPLYTQALLRHGPRHHDLWSQASAPPGSLEEEQPVILLSAHLLVHSQEKNTYRQREDKQRFPLAARSTSPNLSDTSVRTAEMEGLTSLLSALIGDKELLCRLGTLT